MTAALWVRSADSTEVYARAAGAIGPMSGFAGVVAFDAAPIDRQAQDILSRAITALRNGRAIARHSDGALFVQRTASPAATRGEAQPLTSRNGRMLFAASARLDNRDELAAALGLSPSERVRTSDAAIILGMIERWGDAGVARLLGAFAFALWDPEARRLTLGRDCLGYRALFYHVGPRFAAFATTLRALLTLPGVPRAIDEVALANFMVVNLDEERQTFYRAIERVPNRTLVTIDRTAALHRRYWAPDLDGSLPYRREDDYVERARELLDQAVAAATSDTPRVAISASGGLDSSAIAATAARLGRSQSITCFSLVPPAGMMLDLGPFKYLDEREKVSALVRMHPALEARMIAPESLHPFEEDDTRLFVLTNLPVLGPTSVGLYNHLYDAVSAAGHRALLVGNHGDFGLTWWGNFALVALLHDRHWGAFAHELRATARQSNRSWARAFAAEVVMPLAPARRRRLIYRLRGRNPYDVARYSALNPALIGELDLTRQWQALTFDPWFGPRGRTAAQHRAFYLFDHNQLGRDLRGMADEVHGFETRDPLGDRRLLEFVLAVPEPMFRQNGIPRSFARRVLADRLPHEILDERRRGAQTPTWFRRLHARRRHIATEVERLEASPLAHRLIDVPRLKRLLAQWPKDENAAEQRLEDYQLALARGIHVGRFV